MKKFKCLMLTFIFALSGLAIGLPVAFLNTSIKVSETAAQESEHVIEVLDTADYLSVMSNIDNYSSNKVIKLTQNLDFSGVDMKRIYELNVPFMGTFDGNGYQVSNITVSSTDGMLGFIKTAKGTTDGFINKPAVIKNVKLAGTVNYVIDEDNVSTLFIGAILGDGSDVIIENCEVASGTVLLGNNDAISIKSKLTFGGIAGRLTNNSSINNSGCDYTTTIKTYLSATTQAKVGGVVGRLNNSKIFNVISKSKISFFAESSNVSLYFGGLIGESEQENDTDSNSALIYNLIYLGNYTQVEGSRADEYIGAIIGNLIKMPSGRLISCDYWTADLNAFGINNVWTNQSTYNVKKIDAITGAFLLENTNWDGRSLGFDFKQTWQVINGSAHLQVFQTYNYSFADIVDSKNVLDTVGNGGYSFNKPSYRYGEEVVIVLKFKLYYQGYYKLNDVLLNSSIVNKDNYSAVETITDGQIKGYVISFKASDDTDGVYSFNFKANTFDCEILTENFDKGGVRYKDGSVNSSKIALNLTVESSALTIVAVPFNIYSFDHWEFYYKNSDGTLSEKISFDKSSNSTLEIKFASAPFNKKFVLKAFFNSSEAISVGFPAFDKTTIEKVTFSGEEYINDAIKVSSISTKVELAITVKAKYKLDVDSLINNISKLYGENDKTALNNYTIVPGENGTKVYKFNLNIASIKTGLDSAKELNITLLALEDKDESGNNLMWLWITLPLVGGLAVIGIVLFFVFRRRRFNARMLARGSAASAGASGKKSKEKPKKIDYKDYYN